MTDGTGRGVLNRAGGRGVVDGTRGVVARAGRVRVRVVVGVVFLVPPTGGGKEQVGLEQLRRRPFALTFRAGMSNVALRLEGGGRLGLHFVLQ